MSSLRERFADESFWKRLATLRLSVRARAEGQAGLWTTRRVGMSLEFAEYREYHPGDDFRSIDWNLYGRLDRLFVKVFHREEEIPIYLVVDTSRSMAVGNKLRYTLELAGALAYVALKEMDRVGVFACARALRQGVPPRPGLSHMNNILNFLDSLTPAGQTSLNSTLEEFSKLPLPKGLVIVLSDMFDHHGYEQGLLHLLFKRFEVALLHVIAAEDLDPPVRTDARLVDSEEPHEFSVGPGAVARYRANLQRYTSALEAFCREHHIRYRMLSTARPLERALFEDLRGVLFL